MTWMIESGRKSGRCYPANQVMSDEAPRTIVFSSMRFSLLPVAGSHGETSLNNTGSGIVSISALTDCQNEGYGRQYLTNYEKMTSQIGIG